MIVHFGFVIIWMLVDSVLMQLFPNSYLVDQLMFFSQLGFCAMILTIRKFSLLDSILFTFLCGFLFDFCFANMYLLHAFVYVLLALLVRIWSKYMDDTMIESIVLAIVTIFVKDVVIYFHMCLQRQYILNFISWVQRYELKSILIAIVGMIVVYYFYQLKEDYIDRKAQALRKGEKVEWFRLQSKD